MTTHSSNTQKLEGWRRFVSRDVDRDVLPIHQGSATLVLLSTLFCAPYVLAPGVSPRGRGTSATLLAAVALTAGRWIRNPEELARLQHERPVLVSTATAATGVGGVALSGGHRSPFFFSSVCLTALGAGVLDPPRAWRYGLAAGTGVLAAQMATARPGDRMPWRAFGWWLGTPGLYAGAGYVGAQMGRATRLTRALESTIRAEEAAVAEPLHRALGEFGEIVSGMRELVDDVRRRAPAIAPIGAEAAQIEATLARLALVPLVLRAAQREIAAGELIAIVRRLAAAYSQGTRSVDVQADDGVPEILDARSTSVLVAVLKRSLDNVVQHAREATRVEITLERRGHEVVLRVADDGGGVPGPEGTGTRLCRREAATAGGRFEWRAGERGVVVEVTVHAAAATSGEPSLYTEQVADLIEACVDGLRRSTLNGSAVMLAFADDLPRGGLAVQRLCAASGALACELLRRIGDPDLRAASRFAAACLAAAAGRHSKRPPLTGWLAVNTFGLAFRRPRAAVPIGVAATASLAVAGVRDDTRTREEVFTVWGERLFPLCCALFARRVARLLPPVVERERRLGAAVARVAAMDALVQTLRAHHDILAPLWKVAPPKQWIAADERIAALDELEARLRGLVNRLGHDLRPDDDLVEALGAVAAERVAPVPVFVRVDPTVRVSQAALDGSDLELRARRTALRHAVGELVDRAGTAVPPTIVGRRRLERVLLLLSPDGEEGTVRLTARPVPSPGHAPRRQAPGRLADALSTVGGHLTDGFDDGVHAATIPEDALR